MPAELQAVRRASLQLRHRGMPAHRSHPAKSERQQKKIDPDCHRREPAAMERVYSGRMDSAARSQPVRFIAEPPRARQIDMDSPLCPSVSSVVKAFRLSRPNPAAPASLPAFVELALGVV
jgi:hypothetical protein